MKQLIFASNNQNKLIEIRSLLPQQYQILSLTEAGITVDIEEPYFTFKENASEKARVINVLTGKDCFSEDSGLEVAALQGAPGVHSARYAKPQEGFTDNIEKLLQALKNEPNRKANFKTVICLLQNRVETFFEGVCQGQITEERKGANGFGYDPVFIPDGASCTFAEMDLAEKNKYSHRKKAMEKFISFLNHQAP